MAEEEFRLPGSSYDEIVKIIRGYGHFDAEVPLNEVSKVVGVHETVISRNNAFLVAVGIVQGGPRKSITVAGKSLARALDHNMPEEISRHWRELILVNQFFQKLLAAVRIRRGMDESTLQAHIAYSAGQKRNQMVMAGAAAVVQIMSIAGVIREEDGKFVVSDESSSPLLSAQPSETLRASDHAPVPTQSPLGPVVIGQLPGGGGGVSIQIQIQIQCTPDQLDDRLSDKLRELVDRVTGVRPTGNQS